MEKQMQMVSHVPIARCGFGTKGRKIDLLTNHFRVNISKSDGDFYQYSVSLSYEDGRPVEGKGIGRKVIDRVHTTYDTELGGKYLAYDGEKSLFTVGPLPQNKLAFTIVLETISSNCSSNENRYADTLSESDRKRIRRPNQSKCFKVEISFAAKIPMQAIANVLRGQESVKSQDAIRVLDVILRQHAAKEGCLLVRQSFFRNEPSNFFSVGSGVLGCRGFHSSFRTTQGGLSLNTDVSTTMIIRPGPVLNFLLENQDVKHSSYIDWVKAKRMLKNLRVEVGRTEYKITGLSELPCKDQTFLFKQKGKSDDDEFETAEVTVYDYFVNYRKIELRDSANLRCINVGKPKRPVFFPVELCSLVSLQRYTKSLSKSQRSKLVEQSRQKPHERMRVLTEALKINDYNADPMLKSCGVSISSNFTKVEGRVISAPNLRVGNGDLNPLNGRWNFNDKILVNPTKIELWAVVDFSDRRDIWDLVRDLIRCGQMKGILIEQPYPEVFKEDPRMGRAPAVARVKKMFEDMQKKLPKRPKFILCLLERKNSDLYGPWKRRTLADEGIVNQCIVPKKVDGQYLTNVLLKINAKMGGLNSMLSLEHSRAIPHVSQLPTLIIGMDVSHGSPGQDIPSVAAVVSSREWPLISRYRAFVRTQSPRLEMIDSLYKPVSKTEDCGIMREILKDFLSSSQDMLPQQIIIFRDGVSESQFSQVLNIELDQIIQACKLFKEEFRKDEWLPKFVVIIAQKIHHTKFFQQRSPERNVPPGTVIDNTVCHPHNNDFYLCAHAGPIGTSRPTHYHVLLDEIGFSTDDLQEFVHSLSYVYQRSTTAVSLVAPVCYAHLAAAQMAQFMKFEGDGGDGSSVGEISSDGAVPVPELPKLHEDVSSSMFFC